MFEYVHVVVISTVTFYTLSFVVNGFADACAKYSKRRTTNFKLKPISEILQANNFYKSDVREAEGQTDGQLEGQTDGQSDGQVDTDDKPQSDGQNDALNEAQTDVQSDARPKCCNECCGTCKCS